MRLPDPRSLGRRVLTGIILLGAVASILRLAIMIYKGGP